MSFEPEWMKEVERLMMQEDMAKLRGIEKAARELIQFVRDKYDVASDESLECEYFRKLEEAITGIKRKS